MDYSIVFSGKIHEESSLEQVRGNLAKLFRQTDTTRLERLFSGQPVTLKKGLSAADAEKYRQALLKAGAECEIHHVGVAVVLPSTKPVSVTEKKPADNIPAPATGLSLAPLEKKPDTAAPQHDMSAGLALVPIEIKEKPAQVVATSHGSISMNASPSWTATETASNPKDRAMTIKGSGAGYGDLSIIPEGVQGLCWGGFFMPWIWGTFNGVKISFLALPGLRIFRRFVPAWILISLSLLMSLFMLVKGRELAWQNRNWESVEHFNTVQRRWSLAGIAMALVLTIAVPMWMSHLRQQEKIAAEAGHQAEVAAAEKQAKERQDYLASIRDPAEREQAQKELDAQGAE